MSHIVRRLHKCSYYKINIAENDNTLQYIQDMAPNINFMVKTTAGQYICLYNNKCDNMHFICMRVQ